MLDVGDGVVRAHGLVVELRSYTPDEVEGVEDGAVAGEGEDVRLGPHAADLERRVATVRHGDDGLDVDRGSHAHTGHTDGVGHHSIILLQIGLFHIEHRFTRLHFKEDLVHGLHHVHGVLAHAGLGAQHHGVGMVQHGVGHVVHLGTCGCDVGDHALHHLGGHDHGAVVDQAAADDVLLHQRYLLHGDLHAEIAARHHQGICFADDLVDLQQRFGLLDLGDHLGALIAFVDDVLELDDVPRAAHEAEADPIHIVVQCEVQVQPVLLRQAGQADLGIGQVEAFVGAEGSAVDHTCGHRLQAVGRDHFQAQLAVIQQHKLALLHILGELCVAGANDTGAAFDRVGGDDQLTAIG